jgi:hypothetical protein
MVFNRKKNETNRIISKGKLGTMALMITLGLYTVSAASENGVTGINDTQFNNASILNPFNLTTVPLTTNSALGGSSLWNFPPICCPFQPPIRSPWCPCLFPKPPCWSHPVPIWWPPKPPGLPLWFSWPSSDAE